jgi:hypothetical protein
MKKRIYHAEHPGVGLFFDQELLTLRLWVEGFIGERKRVVG